jgi:cytochrome oxidase Cu insertion factor (SCO1/SenC/PrrC family)
MKPQKHYARWAINCLWLVAALGLAAAVSRTERTTQQTSKASANCCPEPASSNVLPEAAGITVTQWLPPARRVKQLPVGLRVTNQNGDELRLSNFLGQPMLISFVYTRCTNPNKCARVMEQAAELQGALEKVGLCAKIRFLIFTYDPEFDSFAVLKAYGNSHGFRFGPNAMMLRVDPSEKAALMAQLEIAVNFNREGVSIHGLQLLLVDSRGFLARVYHTIIWDNDQVISDVQKLAAEK